MGIGNQVWRDWGAERGRPLCSIVAYEVLPSLCLDSIVGLRERMRWVGSWDDSSLCPVLIASQTESWSADTRELALRTRAVR